MSEIVKFSQSVYAVDGQTVYWGKQAKDRNCACAHFKAAGSCDHIAALAEHLGAEIPVMQSSPTSLDTEIIKFQNAYVTYLRAGLGA